MAAAVSLLAMRTEVRRRANQELNASTTEANAFVRDQEINALLNDYIAELYDILVEHFDDEYYRATTAFTTTPGLDTYGLQIDFYKVISVDVVWQPGMIRTAKRFNEGERNVYNDPTLVGWSVDCPVFYKLAGDNLVIIPLPQTAVRISVNYVPSLTPLAADTDTFNAPNQWHMFAIWGAVADVLAKEESDPSHARQRQEAVRARIVALAQSRNVGEAPRVTQTRRGRT